MVIAMPLMDGAVATANANPSLVLADMDALTRQCDAQLAEHDPQLARLAAGIATLEDERAAVLSKRQEVLGTREQALRVQETLLAAARAGAALRGGQRDGRTPSKDAAGPGRTRRRCERLACCPCRDAGRPDGGGRRRRAGYRV